MRLLLLCFSLCITQYTFGQLLPNNRSVNWEQAGCRADYPEIITTLNILDYGGNGNGQAENSAAFSAALAALNAQIGVIYFPEGTYLFNAPIQLPSNTIIRGQSSTATTLLFDLNSEDHLISAVGEDTNSVYELSSNASKGQSSLTISSDNDLNTGDFIYLIDDDEDKVTDEWAKETTGQIVRITAKNAGQLDLSSSLRRDFQTSKAAKIIKILPVEMVGIENLKIERLDQTSEQTSNIHFEYASDCWISCIESYLCNFAHVDLWTSTNIEISGKLFSSCAGLWRWR